MKCPHCKKSFNKPEPSIHMDSAGFPVKRWLAHKGACGLAPEGYTTTDPEKVNCGVCLIRMAKKSASDRPSPSSYPLTLDASPILSSSQGIPGGSDTNRSDTP